jgi:anion-transporting  ArsA/GET3 family ATPase
MADSGSLLELIDRAHIVVCAGTGGVGKTTTSAALGLIAAERGRSVVVVTIDPARRLADALGQHALTNSPMHIEGVGANGGSLHALMLDTKETFDDLVLRYSRDEEQATRILNSRFYRNVAGSMTGTGDYMAMEKLHDLHESGQFDLIVVDTPPTRNALAFLDAPRLISRLLENRLYRVLVTPTRGIARTATTAVHAVVRQLTRVVGADVVDDAIAFFRAFDGMEHGFEQRAQDVLALLRSDAAAFVLVASPRPDTVDEACHFAMQLRGSDIAVRALVVNRLTPRFDGTPIVEAGPHAIALADFQTLAAREHEHVARLRAVAPGAVVAEVPLLAEEVQDLAGLGRIGALLVHDSDDRDGKAGWGDARPLR